jgi:hypothetical protein
MISQAEMKQLQDECLKLASEQQKQPHLSAQLAGLSLGQPQQLIGLMDKWFDELQKAVDEMPSEEQYSPFNPPIDALSAMQMYSALYLAYDKFRPGKRFFFSPSKTAAQRELHDLLDRRAQFAAGSYKVALNMFKSLDEFHGVSRKK